MDDTRRSAVIPQLHQSNGLLDKSSSTFGRFGVLPENDASKEKERNKQQSYRDELTRQVCLMFENVHVNGLILWKERP